MTAHLSGELLRQKSIEAELTKRRLQSRRFNMREYSMNLREIPKEGTLAVESSKLIVKTVQNFKVLCHADSIIDDDDEMIETALLNLATSKRQKDRAPSSMILHRHMQNHNPQHLFLQQNSIVHQKLKGQADLENGIFRVQVKEPSVSRPASVQSNNPNSKIAVAPTFLQLFDLESSRSSRTNECSVNHGESSRRLEVCTPVKDKSIMHQHPWGDAPGRPVELYMPTAKRHSSRFFAASELPKKSNPSSSTLELAAPYSKNYVENYMSKIRHSRLNSGHIATSKVAVRAETTRNYGSVLNDNGMTLNRISTPDSHSSRSQRLHTADSILVSTPSRGSQNDFDDSLGLDSPSRQMFDNFDSAVDATSILMKQDNGLDSFEAMERERMLEQAQKTYAHDLMPLKDTMVRRVGKGSNVGYLRERYALATNREIHIAIAQESINYVKEAASSKSLHVVMPRDETRIAIVQDQKAKITHSEILHAPYVRETNTANIAAPNHYRMSVNILRPFESIVEVAQKYCASPAARMVRKSSQHASPVAVMFTSSSMMS
jgi:hypothetical protein